MIVYGTYPGRSDGSGSEPPWHALGDQLPPHLSEALRVALEGLSDAFLTDPEDVDSALVRMTDVIDQIEEWLMAREGHN